MSATPQLPPVAKLEQKTVVTMISRGKRLDDRAYDSYRQLAIVPGPIEKANGSAEVFLGDTKVMVGVKIESGQPFPDTPDEGVLSVSAELVPLASPSFEPGPPDEKAVELARVVDRGLRESKALDLKGLCLVKGKRVLIVHVDIYVLDHDGNLIDASAIAALAALLNSNMRSFHVKGEEVTFLDKRVPLEVRNHPVPVTVGKVDKTLIVDPNLEEEQVMTARLTITFDRNNNVCAMQKGGFGGLTPEEFREAVMIAKRKSADIRQEIFEAVGIGQAP